MTQIMLMVMVIMVKVKELLEILGQYNPEADIGVKTLDDEYKDELYISYISKVEDKEYTPKSTLQVWVEATDYCGNCQFRRDDYCDAYEIDCGLVDECYQYIGVDED